MVKLKKGVEYTDSIGRRYISSKLHETDIFYRGIINPSQYDDKKLKISFTFRNPVNRDQEYYVLLKNIRWPNKLKFNRLTTPRKRRK